MRAPTRTAPVLAGLALAVVAACRTGTPLVSRTPEDPTTPGTIAGILEDTGGAPVVGRKVHAVSLATGQTYSATTSVTGGFSIPVPPGKYRLQVDLLQGETVRRDPGEIDINESDLDADLKVVIGL